MRTRTLSVAVVLATAATALLTACGGSSGSGSDKIAGVQSGTHSTSASPSDAAPATSSVTFDIPSDVKTVIEAASTGDKNKDALLQTQAESLLAAQEAEAKMDPQLPALAVYFTGTAQAYYVEQIGKARSENRSITGTTRYYKRAVQSYSPGAAVVTYCEDQSKAYAKNAKTGKAAVTTPSASDYLAYTATLQTNEVGRWQVTTLTAQAGASTCR